MNYSARDTPNLICIHGLLLLLISKFGISEATLAKSRYPATSSVVLDGQDLGHTCADVWAQHWQHKQLSDGGGFQGNCSSNINQKSSFPDHRKVIVLL